VNYALLITACAFLHVLDFCTTSACLPHLHRLAFPAHCMHRLACPDSSVPRCLHVSHFLPCLRSTSGPCVPHGLQWWALLLPQQPAPVRGRGRRSQCCHYHRCLTEDIENGEYDADDAAEGSFGAPEVDAMAAEIVARARAAMAEMDAVVRGLDSWRDSLPVGVAARTGEDDGAQP
jgi:hypothetical protein